MATVNGRVQLSAEKTRNADHSGDGIARGGREEDSNDTVTNGGGRGVEGEIVGTPPGPQLVDIARTDSAFAPLTTIDRVARAPFGSELDPARVKYPNVFAWMTKREFPSGKRRDVSRIQLVCTEHGFKATITDYNLSMAYDAVSETLEGLFTALETGWLPNARGWREVKSGAGYLARKEEERKKLAGKNAVM